MKPKELEALIEELKEKARQEEQNMQLSDTEVEASAYGGRWLALIDVIMILEEYMRANKPDTLYVIYNLTTRTIERSRSGIAYVSSMEASNEVKRLKYLYPDNEYEILEYRK